MSPRARSDPARATVVNPSIHRPPNKWLLASAYWLAQAAVIMVVPPVFFGASGPSLSNAFSALDDPEYLALMSVVTLVITAAQAGMIAPIRRPQPSPHARPGWARVLAAGMAVASVGAGAGLYVLHWLDLLGVEGADSLDVLWGAEPAAMFTFGAATIGLGIAASLLFRFTYRNGLPVRLSLVIAGLISGLLIAGIVCALLELIEVVIADDVNEAAWLWFAGASPLIGWVIATPLLIAFVRRRDPDTAICRIASMLFIGSIIEAIAVLPLDIMVRRRTNCYCEEGTFWTLIASSTAGLIALGPAIYLIPIRRRAARLRQGRCPVCGYDLSATPKAERCPECGAGWRAAAQEPSHP